MKIFYFGSVCANDIFNETVAKSKEAPSASAQNFELALIKGFWENNVDLTIVSAESIAMFPNGNRLFLKKRQDKLIGNYYTNIISAINLPLIKQCCHAKGAYKKLKKWLIENSNEEKAVIMYGLYPAVAEKLQKLCKQFNCIIFAFITDVPSTMFTYTKSKNIIKRLFKNSYRNKAISLQDKFDGYIYLTEHMKEEVAPNKPYIVIETIADIDIFKNIDTISKSIPPALMYAGSLYQKYGVDLIIDIFEKLKTDCELWFFGSGDYENTIKEKAKQNSKIKYFGRVSRGEVLKKEKEASILLNVRSSNDDYTKYSFPSKMVEYMLSGTVILTTKLQGIPAEYYSYCIATEERNAEKIADLIDQTLKKGCYNEIGNRAKTFIISQKNSKIQISKVLSFIEKQIRG